jgi:hypothetical protein
MTTRSAKLAIMGLRQQLAQKIRIIREQASTIARMRAEANLKVVPKV